MMLRDYLIDHGDFDWPNLLSGWAWLLPDGVAVWLMNRFGDLFLAWPDGSIRMLDVGGGSLVRLAGGRDDFCRKVDEAGNADDWFMIPLVDSLVAAGARPGAGQCYSFVVPPVLGGGYTVENTAVLPVREHYQVYGAYHDRLRGVPDGERVVIEVGRPPSE